MIYLSHSGRRDGRVPHPQFWFIVEPTCNPAMLARQVADLRAAGRDVIEIDETNPVTQADVDRAYIEGYDNASDAFHG